MKNISVEPIIAELESKKAEIDRAIADLRKLVASGLLEGGVKLPGSSVVGSSRISDLSVFKGAVAILGANGKPMGMKEIVSAILASGKKVGGKNPGAIISTTLYKAVSAKKDCELVYSKRTKMWGLRSW